MGVQDTSEAFFFNGFRLDRFGLSRLDAEGIAEPVALGSRAVDLLLLLVRRPGEVVPKNAIMDAVWPGVAVEESNLTVQISALRRVIDQGRAQRSCIQTIPSRGYRFAVPITRKSVKEPSPSAILSDKLISGATPLSEVPSGLRIPDKPSVAVLPFTNTSNDPEQDFLADGIAEDVITTLSRYPWLFVIARNSSFAYKGRVADVRQVGHELGVRYVVEGSLRRSGSRIRVTAELVEAETGIHVWAERYDRDFANLFAVQDAISEAVTISIAPAIADAEQRRAMRRPQDNVDAWAAYQRGLWHLHKFNPEDNTLAREFFQRAIDIDPRFPSGYNGLCWTEIQAGNLLQLRDRAETQISAEAFARQAIALDAADAESHSALALALWQRGDLKGALAEAELALKISPNFAFAHSMLGAALIFSGHAREGISATETSIRLDPYDPWLVSRLSQMCYGLYFCREYEAAVEAAKRAIHANPDYPITYRWLAAALGQLGRAEEAKIALAKAITVVPGLFDMHVGKRVPWMRPEDYVHMLEGLRKAGWEGRSQSSCSKQID